MATSSASATQSSPRNPPDRLLIKLQTAWQNLSGCTDRAVQAASVAEQAPAGPVDLQALRIWYESATRQLLMDPLEQFFRLQPVKNALDAISVQDPEISAHARNSRTRIDGRFQRILIATALDLPELWRIFRGGSNPSELQSWHKRCETRNKEASSLLERYARWAQNATRKEKATEQAPGDSRSNLWWRQYRALVELKSLDQSAILPPP